MFLLLDFTKITPNKANPSFNQAKSNILLCGCMTYYIYLMYIHIHFARLLPAHCVTIMATQYKHQSKWARELSAIMSTNWQKHFFRTTSFFIQLGLVLKKYCLRGMQRTLQTTYFLYLKHT